MPYLNGSNAYELIGLRFFRIMYLMVVHYKGFITVLVKYFKLNAVSKNQLRGFILVFSKDEGLNGSENVKLKVKVMLLKAINFTFNERLGWCERP